jgi:hypothetical protein
MKVNNNQQSLNQSITQIDELTTMIIKFLRTIVKIIKAEKNFS